MHSICTILSCLFVGYCSSSNKDCAVEGWSSTRLVVWTQSILQVEHSTSEHSAAQSLLSDHWLSGQCSLCNMGLQLCAQ